MSIINPDAPQTEAPSPMSLMETEIVRRIEAAAVSETPFPHITVDGIFPAALYAEMRRHIPERTFYKPITELQRVIGHEYEERLILHLSQLDALPATQKGFWRQLTSWLIGSDVASAFARKFAPVIGQNAGKDPRQLNYGVEAMLVKDLDGYKIGPHTDIRRRAVSAMFYLPSDESYEPFGTALYTPIEAGLRSDGREHLKFDAFHKVATMPCRANSMFAFARSDTSFHGVEPIKRPGAERDVLLYILSWNA
jgi:hypothetical protein